jgi:hypothetical protein
MIPVKKTVCGFLSIQGSYVNFANQLEPHRAPKKNRARPIM